MNRFERAIAAISPRWAFRRRQWRSLLGYYDAAKPSRYRRAITVDPDRDAVVQRDRKRLRAIARDLERNNDLARGVLNVLVSHVVGRGIGVEPQPLAPDGEVDDRLAARLRDLWREWSEAPDVSGRYDMGLVQRLMARAWLRDGEALAQHLLRQRSRDGLRVPYALELVESDWLSDTVSERTRIFDGIELDGWRRPVAYHFHRRASDGRMELATRRVEADRVVHLALVDRVGQLRGVSLFASVITRLQDLRDYEESERVAAKVAAAMTALVRKGSPDMYEAKVGEDDVRELTFRPGTIFDDLKPGESVDVIDTKRPNQALPEFRTAMLRAVAAGVGAGFSSIARQYDGTYSAQRQELVEQWSQYAALSDHFVAQFMRPIYRRFVAAAVLSGAVRLPNGMDARAASQAMFIPPAVPWIDPEKEANAWRALDEAGYASPQEIIRRRGLDPEEVLRQRREWNRMNEGDVRNAGIA